MVSFNSILCFLSLKFTSGVYCNLDFDILLKSIDVFITFSSGFIEFVVMPAFDVVNEMLDILLETKTSQAAAELGLEGHGGKERAWVAPLADNRRRWKEQCQPTTKGNHNAILAGFDYTICHSNLLLNESMALLRTFPHWPGAHQMGSRSQFVLGL